ncbi:MAG: alpha-L-fucosidase [Lentisphaerae bacterium]|nr:alpha-L-fucosidase [Lentisphaerota bacterium]MCP4103336.1 alpha-L-fucosidase [Lentisphaerota bacterium]
MAKADTTWFDNAKFGMFVHFGLYSNPAGIWKGQKMGRNWYAEWLQMQADWPKGIPKEEYMQLANEFNPVDFDAEEWIKLCKESGAKYFLITAKHHDGFALWDSKVSDYNIVKATPFKRDILRELKDACDKYGIIFGCYYSHWQDWEHEGGALPHWPELPESGWELAADGTPIPEPPKPQPSQEQFEKYWQGKCLPQVAELISEYDAKFFWFDSWRETPFLNDKRINELITLCHKLDPECLVNSRIGTTWNHSKGDDVVDYISMFDNHFPGGIIKTKWETSGTFNRSWGYHKLDFAWNGSNKLLRYLIDNVSRNGNFQLNCGPTGSGKIPAPSYRRMKEMGAWLYANGEAVYNTRHTDYKEPLWGRLTQSIDKTKLYAVIYDNDTNQQLIIEGVAREPNSAEILETGQKVEFKLRGSDLIIQMPADSSSTELNVIVFQFNT